MCGARVNLSASLPGRSQLHRTRRLIAAASRSRDNDIRPKIKKVSLFLQLRRGPERSIRVHSGGLGPRTSIRLQLRRRTSVPMVRRRRTGRFWHSPTMTAR